MKCVFCGKAVKYLGTDKGVFSRPIFGCELCDQVYFVSINSISGNIEKIKIGCTFAFYKKRTESVFAMQGGVNENS